MSYENKEYILQFFEGIHEEENRAELIEVYRKAKSWDKYKAHMESHIAGEINEEEFVSDLKSDYFESGESDA